MKIIILLLGEENYTNFWIFIFDSFQLSNIFLNSSNSILPSLFLSTALIILSTSSSETSNGKLFIMNLISSAQMLPDPSGSNLKTLKSFLKEKNEKRKPSETLSCLFVLVLVVQDSFGDKIEKFNKFNHSTSIRINLKTKCDKEQNQEEIYASFINSLISLSVGFCPIALKTPVNSYRIYLIKIFTTPCSTFWSMEPLLFKSNFLKASFAKFTRLSSMLSLSFLDMILR